MKKILAHNFYFLMQFVLLTVGFSIAYLAASNISLEFLVLCCMLVAFSMLGIVHHSLNHDLKGKIVLEYILIAILVLACFLLVKSGRF